MSNSHLLTLPEVCVVRAHHDDFISHIGWWAVMEQPTQVSVGQVIRFTIGDFKTYVAECTGVWPPSVRPIKGCEVPNDFVNWWVITYCNIREVK